MELNDRCRRHGVARFIYASYVAVSFIGVPIINAPEDDPMPAPDQVVNFYNLEANQPQVTRINWQFIISSTIAILIIF